MTREETAQRVLDECFWDDYSFDVGELLARIDEGSDYFDSLLIMRVVDNARHPCPLLRSLYPVDRVLSVLQQEPGTYGDRRRTTRRAMVKANISGDYTAAPVRQWVR